MTVVVHTEHDALTAVLVQPLARGGIEVLVGIAQEAVFGPLVVFGLGGVATDLLGDHSARLSPLTDADARADRQRASQRHGTKVPGNRVRSALPETT